MRRDKIKTILVISWAVALGLVVVTFFVVFYPTVPPGPASSAPSTSSVETLSSAANATGTGNANAFASTTLPGNTTASAQNIPGQFASNYTPPYPVSWQEGGEAFSVTGASFQGDELSLTLAIQMGSVSECVPVNVRLVADEAGTLRAPDAPAGATFSFPDTQSCNGTPGETYSESLVFNTDSVPAPFLLTTGGTSNTYFFAATTTAGGVDITLPGTQG